MTFEESFAFNELISTLEAAKKFLELSEDYYPDTEDGIFHKLVTRIGNAIEAAKTNQQNQQKET